MWIYLEVLKSPGLSVTSDTNWIGFAAAKTGTHPVYIVARYYNDGDLGLGREMQCKTFATLYGPGVACYVTKFSGVDIEDVFGWDPGLVLEQMDGGHGFATVAMVYEPPASNPNAVEFMVYNAQ